MNFIFSVTVAIDLTKNSNTKLHRLGLKISTNRQYLIQSVSLKDWWDNVSSKINNLLSHQWFSIDLTLIKDPLSLTSLMLYNNLNVARNGPKCSRERTRLLKTEMPMVLIYLYSSWNTGTSIKLSIFFPYHLKKIHPSIYIFNAISQLV